LGSGYVVDHCILAFNRKCRRDALEYYITDGIKCISESVANQLGGSYMQTRFADIIKGEVEQDERTGDEIAADIILRAGLKVRSSE
jgi:hypothetical protein